MPSLVKAIPLLRGLLLLLAVVVVASSRPVAAQNLVPDPTFSFGIAAWAPRDAFNARVDWIGAAGADGTSGFARLTARQLSPGAYYARICLEVQPGTVYSWGGSLRLPAAMNGFTGYRITFFQGPLCTSTGLLGSETPLLDGLTTSPDVWYSLSGPDAGAPAMAESVALEVRLGVADISTLRSVDFDNVYFGRQGTGPPAPAFVAVPVLGDVALVILAAALALVSVWLLANR